MADIEVRHCLVCEDIRQEILGKISINGLFGIAPDVRINLKEINKSVADLIIGFYVSGKAGVHQSTFTLKLPSKEVLVELPLADFTIPENSDSKMLLGVELSGIVLPVEGDYEIQLSDGNGELYFTTPLKIGVADSALFESKSPS
ncbi:MAG: hypothetical protein ABL999_14750 [Pyrinomonadaceae bacterium]